MLPGDNLPAIFAAQMNRFGDRIAVSCEGRHVTYRKLDRWSDKVAGRLRDHGVNADQIVGLCVDRSVEMIVGMLGILKSGGAYLPIDPTYPTPRIEYLLNDGQVSIVVGSSGHPALATFGGTVIGVNDCNLQEANRQSSRAISIQPQHLAYVIYTSGTTGEPKGVLIEHRNVVRLFGETQNLFGLSEQDVWTSFHSMSFDFSVWEIWGALLYGGRLVIVPQEAVRNPLLFLELLQREKVTILNQTPSAFYQLMVAEAARRADSPPLSVRTIVFGGERLDLGRLQSWTSKYGFARPDLVNMYGITETTVHATYRRLRAADFSNPESSPIGVPIADLEIRLLDDAGAPTKVDDVGRLFVGGPGLARGYHHRPELTAAKFVTIPGSNQRFYDSGDCAKQASDGELYFLGRADDQIKVRGFRIEPREIEICLACHAQVVEAVVVCEERADGEGQLTAYLTVKGGESDRANDAELGAQIREHAAAALPSYMVPSELVIVEAFPLTAHGKIDRAQLKNLIRSDLPPSSEDRVAQAECETTINAIVSDILKRPLSCTADLFDQGVTSLSFVRILTRINEHFGLSLNGSELGDEATIARLGECVSANVSLTSSS